MIIEPRICKKIFLKSLATPTLRPTQSCRTCSGKSVCVAHNGVGDSDFSKMEGSDDRSARIASSITEKKYIGDVIAVVKGKLLNHHP